MSPAFVSVTYQNNPMKKLNPNFLNWLFNLLGLLLVGGMIALVIMAVATGCSPAKKIEKAKQTVLMDGKARHDIFLKELELYPCVNDSFTTFLPGGVDSVPFPVPVLDTTQRKHIIDSLQNAFAANCDGAVSASYDAGYHNAMQEIKGQKLPLKRPDTLQTTTKDKQKMKLDADSINRLNENIAFHKGQKDQWKTFAKQTQKEKLNLFWWFVAAAAALALTNGLWIYARIRTLKLPKI